MMWKAMASALLIVALADCGGGDNLSGICACSSTVNGMVHLPLACLCPPGGSNADCPPTVTSFDATSGCAQGSSVFRQTGCGKVAFLGVNLSGGGPTFDNASGALIGVSQASDIPWGTCQAFGTFAYSYGETLTDLDCSQIQRCKVCGSIDLNGVDPC